MLLNSHSSRKKNSFPNKPMKLSSNKKIIQKNIKYQKKTQYCVSQFQVKSLNKNKEQQELNVILNNKPLKEEKLPENNHMDENSTFIFTGDNASCADNNLIIENYLKRPLVRPIFDSNSISTILHKEENEIKSSKENSFSLSSSKTSLYSRKNPAKKNMKNNEKLMKILKELNSSNSTLGKVGLKKDKDEIINGSNNKEKLPKLSNDEAEKLQRKRENKIEKDKRIKGKKQKILYFVFFVFINILAYSFLFINLFEPSVTGLFYDNDHDNYKYSTSLLSQDRSIVMNK